ncbi:hypothetical protein BU17DRAFT_68177 [Hysterangium stoloniferum]|nr:hypothetical protein BU17DRAFT_68177 [Hysterangium stoloniferum]
MSIPQQLPQAQSTTPASSTYSQSNSSQHDPSSPPHFTSDPSVGTTMYQTNPASNRNTLEPLDHSHPHSQAFRTSTAFNPAFSTNSGPFSPNAFSPLGPSPNQTQQQQQHRQQYQSVAPFSSQFPQSQQANNYPTKADVFGTSDRYEYDSYSDNGHLKQQHVFNVPFTNNVGSALLQSQQVQLSKQQQTYVNGVNGNAVPYLNGTVQGPTHHTNIQGTVNGIGFGGPPHGGQHPMHHAPGPGPGSGPPPQQQQQQQQQQGLPQQQQGQHVAQQQQQQQQRSEQSQEEISTIFVVGFPEDMQEREFQNMFTFSVGFEAATLKIPNKDSSAYGPTTGASGTASSLRQAGFLNTPYTGSQDPYNLVTVNSGGVVVDGPQGTSSSWQQQQQQQQTVSDPYTDPVPPPRKQIIGFAKFRSRQEALDARDVLQGRRVDIEKGAVLKAEMAKKNLHTKRGVGPLGLPVGLGGGGVPVAVAVGAGGVPELGYTSSGNETLTARDRELGALGAMGLGVGLGVNRNEEERKRKEREIERNSKLRMSNATLYDAFHSVGNNSASGSNTSSNGRGSNGTPIAPTTFSDTSTAFPGYGFQSNSSGNASTFQTSHTFANPEPFGQNPTWALPSKPSDASQPQPQQKPVSLPPRPPSSQSSPPHRSFYGSDSSAFSPAEFPAPLPPIGPRPRPHSPVVQGDGSRSGSSSIAGSQSSLEGEFSRTLTLPSPGSGGSSNNPGRGNASDQNPPINTLYVGNLPNAPVPAGYPPNYLEDYLRGLFSQCPGYRKLCFRQKSNGPMCFVEFEDVNYATRALNELYGNQLNGLVKGGIRLSFSKNPLGVRPPPSTTNSHQGQNPRREWNGQMQQQHQQQQAPPGLNYAVNDAYQPRQQQLPLDVGAGRPIQNQNQPQNDILGSPGSSYGYGMSSPPSRFFSPPPTASFSAMGSGPSSAFPRSASQVGFGVGLVGSQHSPPSYNLEGDERARLRETPPHPHQFAASPGLEASTRVL